MNSGGPVVSVLLPRYQTSPDGDGSNADEMATYEQRVFHYLGMDVPKSYAIPTANCHHYFDYGVCAPGGTLAAEPIHIAMDSDHGRLIPESQLQLELVDGERLCESINEFLADDGLWLEFSAPTRWYLHGCQPDEIVTLDTLPAHALAGRSMGPFLPRQAHADHWRRLLTEIQMCLHAHPVNQARQRRHLLPINGVWFWGGSVMSLTRVSRGFSSAQVVYADDPFTVGLCRAASTVHRPLAEFNAQNLGAGSSLVVDTAAYEAGLRGSPDDAEFEVDRQQAVLLKPLREQLMRRSLSKLTVETSEGGAEVSWPKASWWHRLFGRGKAWYE